MLAAILALVAVFAASRIWNYYRVKRVSTIRPTGRRNSDIRAGTGKFTRPAILGHADVAPRCAAAAWSLEPWT